MPSHMYILECADGSYYVGSTTSINHRLSQHEAGEGSEYTKHRLPVKLAYAAEFDRIDEAFAFEKQVQGWSRRKRQALIDGDFEKLPNLARADWQTSVVSSPDAYGIASTTWEGAR